MRTVDFEQARDLWRRVYDDDAKERFVGNVRSLRCSMSFADE
jgi:catalase